MKNQISVRSILVDKSNGQYIKAVNELDLLDYVQLFTKSNEKSEIVLFDFSQAVEIFHDALEKKLNQIEYKELTVKRGTVFNTWVRLKSYTNENLLCQAVSQVCRDSEEVLSWIYTRLPDLKRDYYWAKDEKIQNNFTNEKNKSLLKLSNEIEAFIEVLLCSIHSTVKVDINYFKSDFIVEKHCSEVRSIVVEILKSEMSHQKDYFDWNSFIYQCCMETLEINPEALLLQIGSNLKADDLRNEVISRAKIVDMNDENCTNRGYTVTWPSFNEEKIKRVKILSQLLQKIDSIVLLVEKLKSNEIHFNDDKLEQAKFESSLESIFLNQEK